MISHNPVHSNPVFDAAQDYQRPSESGNWRDRAVKVLAGVSSLLFGAGTVVSAVLGLYPLSVACGLVSVLSGLVAYKSEPGSGVNSAFGPEFLPSSRPAVKGVGEPVKRSHNDLASFRTISLSGIADLRWHQGPKHSVEITAQPNLHDYLDTRVEGGELIVGIKRNCGIRTHKITVDVWSPHCDVARAKGSTRIKCVNEVAQDAFRVDLSGSASFEGRVNVRELTTNIHSSAKADISGEARKHDIKVSGSGFLNAEQLQSLNCKADISSSGSAKVTCNNRLDCHISGSGELFGKLAVAQLKTTVSSSGKATFTGQAASHDLTVSGSGDVDALNLRTDQSEANISTCGRAKIFCESGLKASVSGSGVLEYKGLSQLEKNISRSGGIRRWGG